MLVDCDHIHGGSRKVISRISRVILPLLGVLTLSKNSKGNFVRFRGELGCGKEKPHFSPVTRCILDDHCNFISD